ncbi:MAG: shikimate kinase [Bacteroidetes bacterium]|nr:shikimate kinase [Bacteroidota bacterium]
MKTVYILIGLKGSGKTYIGNLLYETLSIPFLRVENIFLKTKTENPLKDQNYISSGFRNVENEIRSLLMKIDQLTIESTGIGTQFESMVSNLKKDFIVKLIKVSSDPELCYKRVKNRDQSDHISVSDDQLFEINKLAGKVLLNFDQVIHNNTESDSAIIEEFRKMR